MYIEMESITKITHNVVIHTLTSAKPSSILGKGRRGGGVWGSWGGGGRAEREIINPSLNCHHQNDFCIKVGSDESYFNVSQL